MQLPARRLIADRIWQWRKTAYAVSVLVVLAALVLVFLSISTPSAAVEIPTDLTFFDSQWAFQQAQSLARLYPERQLGSQEALGATAWYEDVLASQGIEFARSQHTLAHGVEQVTVTNVAVVLQAQAREQIVVSSPKGRTGMTPRMSPLAQGHRSGRASRPGACVLRTCTEKTLILPLHRGRAAGAA